MALTFSLYNTLTGSQEKFVPIESVYVRIYACGPTVYDFVHIGNFRTYLFEDTLRRALEYGGYRVRFAINITDVGHLVGDGDEGEDKLEAGARREGKDPLAIAKIYEEHFWSDAKRLNIRRPDAFKHATDCIPVQLDIIKRLISSGNAYVTEYAIYFDTASIPDYGKLVRRNHGDQKTRARDDVVTDTNKRNPADFALWFFIKGRYRDHILRWPSEWGDGFPGWHIECSAISRELLGQPFDIHAAGEDLAPIHHTNEIAQSEAAFGTPLAHVWMHGGFLKIDGGRMGKSLGNAYTLADFDTRGIDPLAYRYLTLTAHYRQPLNFTWDAIHAAENAFLKLIDTLYRLRQAVDSGTSGVASYKEQFSAALADDLSMPRALSIVWDVVKDDDLSPHARYALVVEDFDAILGLSLAEKVAGREAVPEDVISRANERESLRIEKRWAEADLIRDELSDKGFEVRDTEHGPVVLKR